MSIFSPPRYQPPFNPAQRESLPPRLFTSVEKAIKGVLFGCRMCGNCILQETAFICPVTCPKGLRNGLCGGASPEACEVDPSRPCPWYKIYERAEKMGRLDKLLEINAPIDGSRAGRETWLETVRHRRERGQGPYPIEFLTNRDKFNAGFRPLKQIIAYPPGVEYNGIEIDRVEDYRFFHLSRFHSFKWEQLLSFA